VANVFIRGDRLEIKLSLIDQALGFHGSFDLPLSHVTNAFSSSLEDLELEYNIAGTNLGFLKTVGIFANPQGLIFVDAGGDRDCLVIETRGERFPRIAVQLGDDRDPNALAHEITQRIPDSGPVD
jgi:hypothetical protein